MRSNQAKLEIAVVGVSRKAGHADLAVALLCSVVLHVLVLLPFVLERHRAATISVIPVEVVVLTDEAERPAHAPPDEVATDSSPAAAPLAVSSSDDRLDDFVIKLRRLAALRQPDVDARISNSRSSPSRASSMTDAMALSYISDFIRAQVARRWSLDLATLGNRTFSVLIRIEITSAGVVTKADLVRDARLATDKAYLDVARSARNAVLLSSPLALPSGHYEDRMALTLSLHTSDVLR
jgi:hypothetical protein